MGINKLPLAALISSCLLTTSVYSEEVGTVEFTISMPTDTMGLGSFALQKDYYETCSVIGNGGTLDTDQVIGSDKESVAYSLAPGTYSFYAKCFGPADSLGKFQTYFMSEEITQTVYAGVVNTIDLELGVLNPKTVTATVTQSNNDQSLSPGSYYLKLNSGDTMGVEIDENLSFTTQLTDSNPPISLLDLSGEKIGEFSYEKYTYNLYRNHTIGYAWENASIAVDVGFMTDNEGCLFDSGCGILHNDHTDSASISAVVPASGQYKLIIKEESAGDTDFYTTAIINADSSNVMSSLSTIGLTVKDNIELTLDFSATDTSKNYRVFLLLEDNLAI